MSDNNYFMPKEISPHAVVTHLQNELSEIHEIYAVVKRKDGEYYEVVCGEIGNLAFAIMILQKYGIKNL